MKYVNKWNLPLLTLAITMALTAVAVVIVFVLRLLGLTNLDIIAVTIPLGIVVTIVFIWAVGLVIYSKWTHKGFLDDNGSSYDSDLDSDDGWE